MVLAQHAVHGGLSGRTDMLVSFCNDQFVHVPLPLVIGRRKQLDPLGHVWQRVLEATGKPGGMARVKRSTAKTTSAHVSSRPSMKKTD